MLSNGFTNESIVASKSGAAWDARQCETQTRSNGETYACELFNSLSGWTTSGGVSIVTDSGGDPAIGDVLDLSTGSTTGSACFIQKIFSSIPSNFGISIFPSLITIGNYLNDALLLQVQKTANQKNIQIRFNSAGVHIFLDGAWQQLSTHSNTSFCEWWFEVSESGGTDTIAAYAGTQYVNSISGSLPNGPSGNAGLVYIGQESQVNNYRHSQVAYFSIGSTQLCDDFSITTTSYSLTVPTQSISGILLVEDTSNSLSLNSDIILEISINNGSYTQVSLTNKGTLCNGVIDSTKPINILTGTLSASCDVQDTITMRVKVFNHKFIGLHHVGICPTSTF